MNKIYLILYCDYPAKNPEYITQQEIEEYRQQVEHRQQSKVPVPYHSPLNDQQLASDHFIAKILAYDKVSSHFHHYANLEWQDITLKDVSHLKGML
jgi:hypothetical protein